ncbi:mitochondrial 39-S ribosomal protein L47 (MRP-L47)-domain-containing protein [Trametes gibbosa]|nr:mitochondrial 39-S ribosomal protein L47 (MRP-L47)-domain-containing protein [Trametes gibbosa]
MLPPASSRAARSLSALPSLARRTLATHVPAPSASVLPSTTSAASSSAANRHGSADGALRPHMGIEVNPNHGLYAFFRRQEKDGNVSYETVEPADLVTDKSGRAWTAAELRRKSFKDLHTLWYVVIRERNLLATQEAEARRMGANEQTLGLWAKAFRCRKTMARIKYVINERRVAYEGALKIFNEQRDEVLKKEDSERVAAEAQAALAAQKVEKEQRRERSAADVAAESLFETVPASTSA